MVSISVNICSDPFERGKITFHSVIPLSEVYFSCLLYTRIFLSSMYNCENNIFLGNMEKV